MKTPKLILASLLAVFAGSSLGCGSSDRPELGDVHGTVTMDGAPLANAQVVFSPEGGRPSTGVTDAAGKYTLTYIRDIKGAKVGNHSVRIESVPAAPSDPEAATKEAPIPFKETIPAKYNAKSTLTAEVKPGENTIDFPLESK